MPFDTLTFRTTKVPSSVFVKDPAFSLSKMLTVDPTQTLLLEEFLLWAIITLSLVSGYYVHSLFKGHKKAQF